MAEVTLNAYKVYRLLFDLLEDQEGVEITFTLREKEKEEKENEPTNIKQ